LRRLAASSIQHDLVLTDQTYNWNSWLPENLDEADPVRMKTDLWDRPWIFLLMLFLFLGELMIRRRYKLV
jgi:hypothetical protein